MIEYSKPKIEMPTTDIKEFKNVITDNLKAIIKSIAEQFPESSFATEHVADDLIYLQFDDVLKMAYEYFSYEIIGLCGCGTINNTIDYIVKYLTIVAYWTDNIRSDNIIDIRNGMMHDNFNVENISDDPLLQFMAYILDDLNFTDHCSSINGTWITDLGRVCLYVYKIYLKSIYDDEEDE